MNSTFLWLLAFTVVALLGILAAFCVAVASLVAAVRRWGSPDRRGHVLRMSLAVAAIPILLGAQQTVQWIVFNQWRSGIDAALAERAEKAAVVGVGEAAPEFSLTTASGDNFSLPAADKVVLINFFATWCEPCKAELPHIEEIWKRHQANPNFRLLVIGRQEDSESVLEYRERNGFTFPVAADPDRRIYSLFAKELIPRTVVVGPDGQVVYSKAGFREEELAELQQLLEERLTEAAENPR